MNKHKIDLVKRIFSDAHIVDIDFSEWDRKITLCVLSDHYRDHTGGRIPVILVDLLNVVKLEINFNHLNINHDEISEHFQWRTDTISIEYSNENLEINLSGYTAAPEVKFACKEIESNEIEIKYMDRLFPRWDRPGAPFVRPGIMDLIHSFKKH